jgi:hypothetical protein
VRIDSYTVVWKGEVGPARVRVQVNQCLGWAEIEINNSLYQILGHVDNPNLLFTYDENKGRMVATLESVLRSALQCPADAQPDLFASRVSEAQPIVAAYRKAKALADRFSENWRNASNADEIKSELRRRYDEADAQFKRNRKPGWIDDRIALGSWLGAEDTLGQSAREFLSGQF